MNRFRPPGPQLMRPAMTREELCELAVRTKRTVLELCHDSPADTGTVLVSAYLTLCAERGMSAEHIHHEIDAILQGSRSEVVS